MTRMLYTGLAMSNKPNNPDQLILVDKEFSWRVAWNTNRWLFLAFVISTMCDVIFPDVVKHWSVGSRVAVVLAEFLAVLLAVYDVARWVRGMDELQRRITLAALFFAVSASFFFFLLWLRLDRAGFFNAVFGPPLINNGWGIYSVGHAYVLLSFFYGVGFLIFKRRYK